MVNDNMSLEQRTALLEKQTQELAKRTEKIETAGEGMQAQIEDIETAIDDLKRALIKRQMTQMNFKASNSDYERQYLNETAGMQKQLKQLVAKRTK